METKQQIIYGENNEQNSVFCYKEYLNNIDVDN